VVDTSVFVYNLDATDPAKQAAARALLTLLIARDELLVSAQVLFELYRELRHPLRGDKALTHDQASEAIHSISAMARYVYPVGEAEMLRAMASIARFGLGLGDALLWATAVQNNDRFIYTERVPVSATGGVLDGVRYVNPFAPGEDLLVP
jgi:predicted nucleic acid-binding protein